MIKIFAPKAFKLLLREGERAFAVGSHVVEEAVANHWWVKAHSRDHAPVAASSAPVGAEPETAEEIARDAALAAKGETRDELLAQAEELGVAVDKRWGLARLQAAIDAKLAE